MNLRGALAIWPSFFVVMGARVLHAGASCVLGPVIAAISLGLVGHAATSLITSRC
jgi:hypothetical protein